MEAVRVWEEAVYVLIDSCFGEESLAKQFQLYQAIQLGSSQVEGIWEETKSNILNRYNEQE